MEPHALREVAPGVWVRHVEQWHTATTVISAADGSAEAVVVDPAMTAEEIDDLAVQVSGLGLDVVGGVVTHAHVDHVLWRPGLGDVPRWASPRAFALVRERPHEVLEHDEAAHLGIDRDVLRGIRALGDDARALPWGGREVIVLVHDAHSPGHLGLLVPDARVLVAGDMLSAREVPLLDTEAADPLRGYTHGLGLLAAILESGAAEVVVPGHGPVLPRERALAVLAADMAYLAGVAAGDVPQDPRLADPWVRAQHEHQLRALGLVR